jgi:RNA polymerase sigma factor (sigma-70 family)
MDREQLEQQGAGVEQHIWEADDEQLRALEESLPADLAARAMSLAQVLAEVSDEGLVLAVKRGFLVGEASEALLVQRYRLLLCRWCCRWHVPFHDAEDLWQNLFVKFLQTRFDSYHPEAGKEDNFRAYLWATAHNQWVRDLRKKRPEPFAGIPDVAGNGHSAEEILLGKELEQRLEVALGELPEPRQSILRATLDEHSPAEIAEALDRPVRFVYRELFHARRALEEALGLPRQGRLAPGAS